MQSAVIDWDRVEKFIGFGRKDARVLFIGTEEGLLPGSDLRAELAARSQYTEIMDLYEAQQGFDGSGKLFGASAVSQRTWRPMCHLMLRLLNEKPDRVARTSYQAYRLGRNDGDSLLAELMPYPSHDKGAWDYAGLSRFNTREEYESVMGPYRVNMLRNLIRTQRYEIVVCYGKGNWPHFQQIFEGTSWGDIDAGTFRVGAANGARIVLTPHFSGKAFNSELQLDRFADIALT